MIKIEKLVLFIAGFILLCAIPWIGVWTTVSAGTVGVVTRFGAVNRVADPGVVFKLPLFEGVHTMDTRVQKDQVDAQSASKDLQEVKATIAVNYHLIGSKAVEVYQNVGEDYQDKIIAPAIQESFKATTAKFTAEELITSREVVKQLAQKELGERLVSSNILVDNFNIVNFQFSDEFSKAIEAKQVANQEVETAKQRLARITVEASQAAAQAKGQADAQKALKDSGSLSTEYLQYLALTKWNGVLPTVTGSGTPFINIPTK